MKITVIIACLMLGYCLGMLHPAALLGKLKNIDLRSTGTHNLGASNTLLTLGAGYGALVAAFDVLKGWLASRIAKSLFPGLACAGLLGGLGAVIGHVFPCYLQFRGGKGLAAFGGMVLAYNPLLFLTLLILGLLLMFLHNASYVMPMTGAIVFTLYVAINAQSLPMTAIAAGASALIVVKHWSNVGKGRRGEDVDIRGLVRNLFQKA